MRQSPRFATRWYAFLLICTCALTGTGVAQTLGTDEGAASSSHLIAADDTQLWVLAVGHVSDAPGLQTRIYRRQTEGDFRPHAVLKAPVVKVVQARRGLYAFISGGELWSLLGDEWLRERDLPDQLMPVDLHENAGVLYALIPSPAAGRLARTDTPVPAADTQPYDPQDAKLTVARYDAQGWRAIAPAPLESTASNGNVPGPRLGTVRDTLCLFWPAPDGKRVNFTSVAPSDGTQPISETTAPLPNLRAFWYVAIKRVPTLVAVTSGTGGDPQVQACRYLGGEEGHLTPWRQVKLSGVPENVRITGYDHAVSFNQHLVLLARDADGKAWLRFGRLEEEPAEETIAVSQVIEQSELPGQRLQWFQAAKLLVLSAVLVSLLVFRRTAMTQDATLPEGTALAFTFQRFVGWIIDFTPFALIMSFIVGVEIQASLRAMFSWAAGGDASGQLPDANAILWWSVAATAYTLYAFVMELSVGRTIGKLLTGTRVLSDNGERARWWQILVRNILRLLELAPPLWLIGFLVLVSRNRQRFGDIFAKTVVARRLRTPPTPSPNDKEDSQDPQG